MILAQRSSIYLGVKILTAFAELVFGLSFNSMATKNLVHVRRCHVCGTVNELTNAALHKCGHCGKHFAPFYYFEEKEDPSLGDNVLVTSLWRISRSYHPLVGFSTYWEEEFSDTD